MTHPRPPGSLFTQRLEKSALGYKCNKTLVPHQGPQHPRKETEEPLQLSLQSPMAPLCRQVTKTFLPLQILSQLYHKQANASAVGDLSTDLHPRTRSVARKNIPGFHRCLLE